MANRFFPQWVVATALLCFVAAADAPCQSPTTVQVPKAAAVAKVGVVKARRGRIELFALAGLAAFATYADVHYSHVCEARVASCREGNPALPRNAMTLDLVETGITGVAIVDAVALRGKHPRLWRAPLLGLISAHGFGAAWAIHVRRSSSSGGSP